MTITRPLPSTTTVTDTTDFTTALSRIRTRIGDAGGLDGSGRIYLSDERIADVLAEGLSGTAACVRCVEMILADIAKDNDYSAGTISINRTQVTTQYADLLARLRAELSSEAVPWAGGISITDNRLRTGTDVPARVFTTGMDRQ